MAPASGEQNLPSSVDVAAAIIEFATDVDQMKLHKLLYYAQGWYEAWYGERMFRGKIEAWRYGPYVPSVGRFYGGEGGFERRRIEEPVRGDAGALDPQRQRALKAVVRAYDELSGTELASLTKTEKPWHKARGDLPLGAKSREEIKPRVLREYFRREGRLGTREPQLQPFSEKTIRRLEAGDHDAVEAAFKEALGLT